MAKRNLKRIKVVDAAVFLNVSPKIYADQLTIMDSEVFQKITYEELTTPPYDPYDERNAPNILEMTNRFNHVVFLVYIKILCESCPEARSKVINHFIQMAEELDKLNNFNSLFAVLSGLNSAAISRLKETWKCVPRRMKRKLEKMTDLLSFENNFGLLRSRMLNIRSRCIPYIGFYQKDVIAIDASLYLSSGDLTQVTETEIQLKKLWTTLEKYQKYNYDDLENHIMIQFYLEPAIYSKSRQKGMDKGYYIWSKLIEP